MSNPKYQKGSGSSSPKRKQICRNYGKKHYSDCFIGMDNCFGCSKSVHKVRDFPNMKGQDKGSGQAQSSCFNMDPPKNNHFYALCSRVNKRFPPIW